MADNDYKNPFTSLNEQNKREREAFFAQTVPKNNDRLTKREQFAMAALQGILSAGKQTDPDSIIIGAVKCADLLIEELKTGEKDV